MEVVAAAVAAAEGSETDWFALASIPVFTGVIGWLINWSGVLMLFNPVRFHGFTVPGLRELSTLLPRKLQEIPGIMQGGIGWQGIVPARAAKMGSIAVDKAIAKLGTPAEFYQQLEPDKIAEHIVAMFQPRGPRSWSTRSCSREQPELWANVPPRVKQAVYARVQQQLPGDRARDHRRDRRPHRPAARPEDHGHRPVLQATRRWSTGSSATSARRS